MLFRSPPVAYYAPQPHPAYYDPDDFDVAQVQAYEAVRMAAQAQHRAQVDRAAQEQARRRAADQVAADGRAQAQRMAVARAAAVEDGRKRALVERERLRMQQAALGQARWEEVRRKKQQEEEKAARRERLKKAAT